MITIIYARYSTDKQRDTSIDDQVQICKSRIKYEQWHLSAIHQDEEVSGSTPVSGRTGGRALLADVMAGSFDVLVMEGLDRLSRDIVEQETIVRRMEHRGIRIVCVADGYDSSSGARKLHRGMRGLINEVYLDDLRHKTHRGLSGQVSRGFSAGGVSFGYQSVKEQGGSKIVVNDETARWVVWIFEHYADGMSCQKIAAELNRLGVKSPRNSTWAVSALYGSPKKGSGLLNNELYVGRYIWNRSQWVKDPDNGKRQRIQRPETEWQVEERPDLQIVSNELWQKVRTRMDAPRLRVGSKGRGRKTTTLLGGILRCSCCGGAVVAVNPRLYGCAAKKDRGQSVCRGVYSPRDKTEQLILADVRAELLNPEIIKTLHKKASAIIDAKQRESKSSSWHNQKRLADLDQEISRIIDAIAMVGVSDALANKLKSAEAEKKRLVSAAANNTDNVKQPEIKAVIKAYKLIAMNLQSALKTDTQRARSILTRLLGNITIINNEEGTFAEIETRQDQLLSVSGLSLEVVAGAGFVTKRLIRII